MRMAKIIMMKKAKMIMIKKMRKTNKAKNKSYKDLVNEIGCRILECVLGRRQPTPIILFRTDSRTERISHAHTSPGSKSQANEETG
jgi:hypothetical protein